MAPNLLDRARYKYRKDGALGLLRASAKEPFRRRRLIDGDDVYAHASTVVRVTDGSESEIQYDGRHERPHPAFIQAVDGQATATPRDVCEFRDAILMGSEPIISLDGKFIPPSAIGTAQARQDGWKERETFTANVPLTDAVLGSYARPRPTSKIETGFLLTGFFTGFGHWTFEVLPKLRAYEAYTAKTGEEPTILTRGELTSWQRDSLALLGYPPESIRQTGSELVHVQRLLVPSHRFLTWSQIPTYPSTRDLRWVREQITQNVSPGSESFGDRIFISRADAPRRHVWNRREVLKVLEEYDFEVYEPGRLSFADQVRLFSSPEIVVGPYGAGLSNVIFAEDPTLVELVLDADQNIHHYVLANLLDIDYEFVPSLPRSESDVELRHRDLKVDTETMREVLESICRASG